MRIKSQQHARASVTREYTRLSHIYDRRWAAYIEASTRETLARLRPRPTDRVLDVGCGTGTLLSHLHATHPGTRLVGLDPVREMLAVARRKLPGEVALCRGWAEALPFAPGEFDVVVSCSMFHYLHQPLLALHAIRRVLRPGGQLVITDWCGDDHWSRILALYLRLSGRPGSKVYRAQECTGLAERAGYELLACERYRIGRAWGLMTLRLASAETAPPHDGASSFH